MSTVVSEQAILDSLRHVPSERWGEVLHFLNSLSHSDSPILTGADLSRSEVVGLWADRDDLGNSSEFARVLRRQAERRPMLLDTEMGAEERSRSFLRQST